MGEINVEEGAQMTGEAATTPPEPKRQTITVQFEDGSRYDLFVFGRDGRVSLHQDIADQIADTVVSAIVALFDQADEEPYDPGESWRTRVDDSLEDINDRLDSIEGVGI